MLPLGSGKTGATEGSSGSGARTRAEARRPAVYIPLVEQRIELLHSGKGRDRSRIPWYGTKKEQRECAFVAVRAC
jgi:hypothetical protein